ncbi:MAG: nitroreductase family protein [Actinomycetota bacterium]
MEAYEAITTRRSVPKVSEREPDRDTILRLLHAAVRAPTHHLTQPWRFIVLRGEALEEFGEAWAHGAAREGKDPSGVRDKARRAPVVVAVIERPKSHLPKVQEIEEHHATGAAIQNLLLAAHADGLGAMLRTGPPAHIPEVLDYLGLEEGELVAGYVYVGYPANPQDERPMTRRTDPAEVTEWRGWSSG